jgi:hypothetical protein
METSSPNRAANEQADGEGRLSGSHHQRHQTQDAAEVQRRRKDPYCHRRHGLPIPSLGLHFMGHDRIQITLRHLAQHLRAAIVGFR